MAAGAPGCSQPSTSQSLPKGCILWELNPLQETTTTSHPFGMQPLRNSDQGEVEGDVGFVSHEMVPSGCTSGCDGKGKGSLMGAGQHSGSLCPGARQEGWEEVQLQGQMRLTPISLLEAPDLHQPLLMADRPFSISRLLQASSCSARFVWAPRLCHMPQTACGSRRHPSQLLLGLLRDMGRDVGPAPLRSIFPPASAPAGQQQPQLPGIWEQPHLLLI